MTSKKMWQALLITLVFMFVSAAVAWISSALFSRSIWSWPFGIGGAFMIGSIVFSLLRKKLPNISWLALLLNALACGFFIASYILGKGIFSYTSTIAIPENSPVFYGSGKALFVLAVLALATSGFYLVLMLLLSVPRLKDSKVYMFFSYLIYLAAIFGFGALFRERIASLFGPVQVTDILILYVIFAVAAAALALGSLFHADNFRQLLFALITPSTFSIGFIAVIVLLALACGDGGDCDCDCGDCCGDCCDCSPGYNGRTKKPKSTTFSQMSDPHHFSDQL